MNLIPFMTAPGLPVNLLASSVVTAFRISNFAGQVIVVILVFGSIFAWSILVTKFRELQKLRDESKRFLAAYKREKHPSAMLLKQPHYAASPLYAVYAVVCDAMATMLESSPGAPGVASGSGRRRMTEHQVAVLQKLVDQVLSEQGFALERNMGFLATTVTAAPFLGLLGTVWGVMDAFGGLAMSRAATLSAIAPGVSGALLTTVVGLVVALPSAIGYNMLVARIRRLTIAMERFSQELLADIERRFVWD